MAIWYEVANWRLAGLCVRVDIEAVVGAYDSAKHGSVREIGLGMYVAFVSIVVVPVALALTMCSVDF